MKNEKQELTVGDRIKQRREELGLSLVALSEAAAMSRSYLYELENGQSTTPSAEVLFNIAEALETSVAVLLGKRPSPELSENSILIPQSLREYGKQAELSEEEIHRLACIKYRNRQPKKKEDWAFIHEAIKRAIGTNDK